MHTLAPTLYSDKSIIISKNSHENEPWDTCLWHWPLPCLQSGRGQPSFSPPTPTWSLVLSPHSPWGQDWVWSRAPFWPSMVGKVSGYPGSSHTAAVCLQREEQRTQQDSEQGVASCRLLLYQRAISWTHYTHKLRMHHNHGSPID